MNAFRLGERQDGIVREVVAVAREAGRTPAQIALRWCLDRPGVASPILGARTVAQLEDALGALDSPLAPAHAARLDAASAVELGWPQTFLDQPHVIDGLTSGAKISPAPR